MADLQNLPAFRSDASLSSDTIEELLTPDYYVLHYAEFLPRYIAKGNPSEDTMQAYISRINTFLRWCIGKGYHPLNVHDYEMRMYREFLVKRNYAAESIGIMIVSVRAFFQSAVKLGLIKINPCADIEAPTISIGQQAPWSYSMEQMKQICSVFEDEPDDFLRYRNILILYLMGVEGMRNVEVHRACVEDINWDMGIINVRGKGAKGRVDPIYPCEETFKILRQYILSIDTSKPIQKDGNLTPLILSASNRHQMGRITRNGIRWIMNKALDAAGLKHPGQSCHVLRHSCGTNLYQSTKDLRLVQETLRQKDPKVTARYAHMVNRLSNRATASIALHADNPDTPNQ